MRSCTHSDDGGCVRCNTAPANCIFRELHPCGTKPLALQPVLPGPRDFVDEPMAYLGGPAWTPEDPVTNSTKKA